MGLMLGHLASKVYSPSISAQAYHLDNLRVKWEINLQIEITTLAWDGIWKNVNCSSKEAEKQEQHESELALKEFAEMQEQLESADVTLDPNTANPYLIVSEDWKSVIHGDERQPVPNSPERYDSFACVLGSEGFASGRHYWEVEVEGKIEWILGVAAESANRKGWITRTPEGGYWIVWLWNGTEYEASSSPPTILTLSQEPRKIGVYLDYEGGRVLFYNVDDKSLIFTFNDKFTEKMFPLFSPCTRDGGKNDKPLRICPVTVWE
ncbi:E3 ubiquitin-protein ligase TRIM39-like [Latimeria chalumnae]|uniref:E3 ubiquitin-protein ligase TRIM39-like n=1 Tax=Latimeria chalumnae TaxID=7897 RepID=UPI00313BE43B